MSYEDANWTYVRAVFSGSWLCSKAVVWFLTVISGCWYPYHLPRWRSWLPWTPRKYSGNTVP